jgi:hypothetical protein
VPPSGGSGRSDNAPTIYGPTTQTLGLGRRERARIVTGPRDATSGRSP